jgi:pimeloyl-ACP methyl ester carboxylesterase
LYHSRSRTGSDIAVSGFVIVPKLAAPAGGRPVFAWAHGTVGEGDQCAPSRRLSEGVDGEGASLPPYGGQQLERGAVIAATDYQGLGTPGDPTYSVGVPEGHAVLDSVRAAAQLPGVGRLGRVVLAGHSQGGAATLWAAQLARSYAPELLIAGALASAPGANLPAIAAALPDSPVKGSVLMATLGFRAAYPGFRAQDYLTPAAIADLSRVAHECVDATIKRWQTRPANALLTVASFASVPELRRVLAENTPLDPDPRIPIRIQQGGNDEQVPVASTAELHDQYCAHNADITRHIYPGVKHDDVIDAAGNDALRWIADRYAGKPVRSDCAT